MVHKRKSPKPFNKIPISKYGYDRTSPESKKYTEEVLARVEDILTIILTHRAIQTSWYSFFKTRNSSSKNVALRTLACFFVWFDNVLTQKQVAELLWFSDKTIVRNGLSTHRKREATDPAYAKIVAEILILIKPLQPKQPVRISDSVSETQIKSTTQCSSKFFLFSGLSTPEQKKSALIIQKYAEKRQFSITEEKIELFVKDNVIRSFKTRFLKDTLDTFDRANDLKYDATLIFDFIDEIKNQFAIT